MKLPQGNGLRVDADKVRDYLLADDHPDGAPKAAFFRRHGFTRAGWSLLGEALIEHGRVHPVAALAHDRHGTRYTIDGALRCPDGRRPHIRSVWIVEGPDPPRLVTAFPTRRR